MKTLNMWKKNQPQSLFDMIDELQGAFGRQAESWPATTRESHKPFADVCESEKTYHLTFDLPGLSKEDIKIEFEDGLLSIWGERKNEFDETKDGVHRQERYYGSFRRSFSLPTTVKADKITAKYENGVLKVDVPKIEETQKKTISIQ
jgi:HSP20 family protein